MTSGINKGITSITYNHLNQPLEIIQGNKRTVYLYTATGGMLKCRTFVNDLLEDKTEPSAALQRHRQNRGSLFRACQ